MQRQTDTPAIRPMEPRHLDEAVALSRAAGWPHRTADWALLLELGSGFVALEGGRVVGTAIHWPFGAAAGAVGMVIVDDGLRGRGLGRRLMETAMAAGTGRRLRLVATEAGLPLYRKLGFHQTGMIHQHQGVASAAPAAGAARIMDRPEPEALARIDAVATGADRSAMLRALGRVGRVAVIEAGGAVAGYSVLREFGRGHVIGPVIARDVAEAAALIGVWLADLQGAFVRVDVPEEAGLAGLLGECGLARAGGGIAMSTAGREPSPGPFLRFALANQALG